MQRIFSLRISLETACPASEPTLGTRHFRAFTEMVSLGKEGTP